jgi:hypothetical protein
MSLSKGQPSPNSAMAMSPRFCQTVEGEESNNQVCTIFKAKIIIIILSPINNVASIWIFPVYGFVYPFITSEHYAKE